MSLSSLPEKERPRERLLQLGPEALSLQELLAVLLRTGQKGSDVMSLAATILREYPDERALARATPAELCSFPGLGAAKAAALVAAVELGRRFRCNGQNGGRGRWEDSLRKLEQTMVSEEREWIVSLFTDREGRVLGSEKISFGGLDGAFLDAPYLCRRAVRIGAAGLVLIHNHPDGNPRPSEEDRSLTMAVSKQLKLLGIELVGHFVVAGGSSRPVTVH
ncbi:MAG: DNA repair protein RadC [Synergistaceae bacterium]|nr:DNA repair protein RadC [Synergistaceae bacterium]